MNYWQTMPSTYGNRLDELAQTVSACREAFHETANKFCWVPAAGSGAAQAAMYLPSPDPVIDKPSGETGHRLVTEVIQIFLFNAAAHLGSWAALLRAAEVVSTPPLLLRAVIENCAHVVWLIGNDPAEAPENRLARAYLEELISAEEAKKNAGRLHGKSGDTYARTVDAYKKVKTDIATRFDGSCLEESGKKTLRGQVLPGLEESVKLMYELTASFGGTIDKTGASGLYGILSNLTHPTLYTTRDMRAWTKDETTGYNVANVRVTIESVEKDVRVGLAAFYNAMCYVTSYNGWSETTLRTLESKIEAVIPDFFVTALEAE